MHDPSPQRTAPANRTRTLSPSAGRYRPRTVPTGLLVLAVSACASHPPAARLPPATPAPCRPAQLALHLDAGNGRFDGMSHSGTALVLRNTGARACTLPARPRPSFVDGRGQPLAIVARTAPGAAAAATGTVVLAPGAALGADLRWVSGNVYPDGHCEAPAAIRLALAGGTLAAPFAGRLCGAGGQPSIYTLTSWRPTARPASAATASRTYRCEDGRTVEASYPDTDTALLVFDGRTHRLRLARSADGARYVGGPWQWWAKGSRAARLAPLAPGEAVASARGVACQAPRTGQPAGVGPGHPVGD